MVTKTKSFLLAQIGKSVTETLNLPEVDVKIEDGNVLTLILNIEGPASEAPFWQAVLEQYAEEED